MALTEIQAVRLRMGDTETSPFYPLFSDDEIQYFLDVNNNNIASASRMAAISASMQLAGWATRERTGNIEVWSSLSSLYLKALDFLINNPSEGIPNGLMPWAGGISKEEICLNNRNLDVIQSPLNSLTTCDDLCSTNSCVSSTLN